MIRGKSLLFFGLITFLALSFNAVAGEGGGSGEITLFQQDTTLSQSAVFAAFLSSIDGASSSAISVSNILGGPFDSQIAATTGDTTGPLTFMLFDRDGDVYTFSTADDPNIGTGVDADGNLSPGQTYTVNLNELIGAIFPDDPNKEFNGFAWVVADFDAVAGTYFNFFSAIGASQAFALEPTLGGLPVDTSGSGQ